MHAHLRGRRGPVLLILVHLALGQAFVHASPPWEAPDEPWHLAYAEALAAGRLPTAEETYEHHHPPLYYLWPALGLRALGTAVVPRAPDNPRYPFAAAAYLHPPGAPEAAPMRLLRGSSGLLGSLAVALAWASARRATGRRPGSAGLALLAGGLVAALPQLAFVSHAVSNDGLATVAGAGLLYACLRWARPGRAGATGAGSGGRSAGLRAGLFIGFWLVLALLTKLNALVLAAALPAILLAVALVDARTMGPRGALARLLAGLIGAGLSLGLAVLLVRLALPSVWSALLENLIGRGLERQDALSEPRALASGAALMLDQLWGRYGWFNVLIPTGQRRLAGALALLGLAGLLPAWRRAVTRERLAMVLAALLAGLALAAGLRNLMSDPQAQARLLFPGLAAAALLLALGLEAWLRRLPRRWRGTVAALPVLGLLLLGAYATALRLPEAYAPARRSARPLHTRMVTMDWEIALRLDETARSATQSLRVAQPGLDRIELPVLVASGSGQLRLRLRRGLAEASGRAPETAPGAPPGANASSTLAEARWPLAELGRPSIERPRLGPLADASWIGLDLPALPVLQPGETLQLELRLEGEGRAWLPGARDPSVYPEGALRDASGEGTDLVFVASLREP